MKRRVLAALLLAACGASPTVDRDYRRVETPREESLDRYVAWLESMDALEYAMARDNAVCVQPDVPLRAGNYPLDLRPFTTLPATWVEGTQVPVATVLVENTSDQPVSVSIPPSVLSVSNGAASIQPLSSIPGVDADAIAGYDLALDTYVDQKAAAGQPIASTNPAWTKYMVRQVNGLGYGFGASEEKKRTYIRCQILDSAPDVSEPDADRIAGETLELARKADEAAFTRTADYSALRRMELSKANVEFTKR